MGPKLGSFCIIMTSASLITIMHIMWTAPGKRSQSKLKPMKWIQQRKLHYRAFVNRLFYLYHSHYLFVVYSKILRTYASWNLFLTNKNHYILYFSPYTKYSTVAKHDSKPDAIHCRRCCCCCCCCYTNDNLLACHFVDGSKLISS